MAARPTAISTVDATAASPTYTLRCDLTGVRALPLLRSAADFDKLDGKLQAKLALRSTGNSQRAIMSNLDGTVFAVFQDGAIKRPQRRADDPRADLGHAVGMAARRDAIHRSHATRRLVPDRQGTGHHDRSQLWSARW